VDCASPTWVQLPVYGFMIDVTNYEIQEIAMTLALVVNDP
jgi:hypothetical protein